VCVQTPASLFKKQSICINNMRCPISHIPYSDLEFPVFIGENTKILYELRYLAEWYRRRRTDPCTRHAISWNSIRPARHLQKNKSKFFDQLAHEMSMPMIAVATPAPTTQSPLLVQIMESRRQFVEGFERAFGVQQNGTLKCDKVIRPVVQVIIVRDIISNHSHRLT
jgi:hypothetical protein